MGSILEKGRDVRKRYLSGFISLFAVLCTSIFAQQFKVSEYSDGSIQIEYPPSFDGAYLFVEQNSNLVTEAWETVDYYQISLELGDSVILSAPVSTVLSSSESTNQVDIPYEITPEYLEAVSNGEITNSAWTASSI